MVFISQHCAKHKLSVNDCFDNYKEIQICSEAATTLQTHHVNSTLKRRGNDRFHVVVYEKRCSKKLRKFHKKATVLESLFLLKFQVLGPGNFNKVADSGPGPVKFANILQTPILKNIYKRLLLEKNLRKKL